MKINRDKKVNFIRSFRLKIAIYTLISICATLLTDFFIILLFVAYHKKTHDAILQMQNLSQQQAAIARGSSAMVSESYPFFTGISGLTESIVLDFIILIAFSVMLFIIYFIIASHNMVNYLREIQKGIERIKDGDFDTNIRIMNEDELSIMAQSINEMRYTIKSLIQKERIAEKTKNDLITNVAHDLRTPLTSIIGYLELIRKGDLPEDTRKKYLRVVYDKAKRLQNLVVDLFDYTRYAKDGVSIRKSPLEINRFLEQLIEEFYPSFQETDLECQIKLSKEDILLDGDGELLARAFSNLLGNALKYGIDGKLIIVETRRQDQWAVVSITNFGHIIPKADLNKIFDKFYRVESSRSVNTGGTGLGLAITKNIIALHHGMITVKSDEEGTIFEVSLPIEIEEKEELPE